MARPTRFERVASTFGGQRSIYAARRGIALSTNRKNRWLRAPATNDSCVTPIPGYVPFRRDRVLRVLDLSLRRFGPYDRKSRRAQLSIRYGDRNYDRSIAGLGTGKA